jgi:hypothetical protein
VPVPKLFLALLSVLAAPAWAGLFGTDAPGRIPIPARDFRARVEDRSGVVTELDRATFDGEVFVFGTVGARAGGGAVRDRPAARRGGRRSTRTT